MQTQLVARLLDKNPDSLPLLMMRGHALLVSGKPGAALRCYFQVCTAAHTTQKAPRSRHRSALASCQTHLTLDCAARLDGSAASACIAASSAPHVPLPHTLSTYNLQSTFLFMTRSCRPQAYQMLPEDSVVNLAIAVAHLSHACSRSVGDRHACVLKAFAFFCRHARSSSNRQEACYNLARAFHHLELNHMAAEWYERSLVLGGAASGADSLAFEAGHNLALIYEGSGAAALAMRTRALYCSV